MLRPRNRALAINQPIVKTQRGEYFVAIGKRGVSIYDQVGHHKHLCRDVYRVSDAYKLVSRKVESKVQQAIELGDGVERKRGRALANGWSLLD